MSRHDQMLKTQNEIEAELRAAIADLKARVFALEHASLAPVSAEAPKKPKKKAA